MQKAVWLVCLRNQLPKDLRVYWARKVILYARMIWRDPTYPTFPYLELRRHLPFLDWSVRIARLHRQFTLLSERWLVERRRCDVTVGCDVCNSLATCLKVFGLLIKNTTKIF